MIDLTWGRIARLWAEPLAAWRSTQPAPTDPMQLGEAARRLLDDPTLHLALERIQARLMRTWRGTATADVEAREEAFRLLWASEELKAELRRMLGDARAIENRDRINGTR